MKDTVNQILNSGVRPQKSRFGKHFSFQLLWNSINIPLSLHIPARFLPLYDCASH